MRVRRNSPGHTILCLSTKIGWAVPHKEVAGAPACPSVACPCGDHPMYTPLRDLLLVFILTSAALTSVAPAQDQSPPLLRQGRAFTEPEAAQRLAALAEKIQTPDEWRERAEKIRQNIL